MRASVRPKDGLDEKTRQRAKKYLQQDFSKEPPMTMVKAIREKCMDCSGWMKEEVDACTIKHCALWPYRKKTPYEKK